MTTLTKKNNNYKNLYQTALKWHLHIIQLLSFNYKYDYLSQALISALAEKKAVSSVKKSKSVQIICFMFMFLLNKML